MRKSFLAAAGLLLTSSFSSQVSHAQDYAYSPFPKAVMVSFMANDMETEKAMKTVSIDANTKLQKSFSKQFKNAGNVNWYNLKKNYLAVFDNEGRKTRALYTKNGFNIYAITYGGEKDLPKNYRHMIKSMYVDYDISNAIEIASSEVKHKTWLTMLKSDDQLVIARIADGGLDEFARYDTKPKVVKKQRKGRVIIPRT